MCHREREGLAVREASETSRSSRRRPKREAMRTIAGRFLAPSAGAERHALINLIEAGITTHP
jgi:hypothetical protein